MLVSEIMSTPVITATADETVPAAAALMREQGVGSVVVVDKVLERLQVLQ